MSKKNKLPEELEASVSFKCLNKKQEELRDSIINNDVTICTGIAGSGKTFISLGTALELLGKKYKRVVFVKSVVTIPEEAIGFIPGTVEQKMEPFMYSFTGNVDELFGKKGVAKDLMHKGLVEVLPLAYIRGVTQNDCIVVADECQNMSVNTFRSLMTRIGRNCKYVLLGDTEQIDRKKKEESCLSTLVKLFENDENVNVVQFSDDDCVRNPIIKPILEKLRQLDK